jgi:hypothetical protein
MRYLCIKMDNPLAKPNSVSNKYKCLCIVFQNFKNSVRNVYGKGVNMRQYDATPASTSYFKSATFKNEHIVSFAAPFPPKWCGELLSGFEFRNTALIFFFYLKMFFLIFLVEHEQQDRVRILNYWILNKRILQQNFKERGEKFALYREFRSSFQLAADTIEILDK